MSRAFAALATVIAVLSLAVPASAQPASDGAAPLSASRASTKVDLPAPEKAKEIVSILWAQREQALNAREASTLDTFDSASARMHDIVYLVHVVLGDESQLVPHPVVEVITLVPKESDKPVFFAELRTTNGDARKFAWYMVAVERGRDAKWKLAFVSFAGRDAHEPPLRPVKATSHLATPGVTADTRARIERQAMASVHKNPATRTADGVVVRSRGAVMRAKEGIYGLALSSGEVVTCYTWHTIGTVTYPGHVLVQTVPKYQWGRLLKPGTYASLRMDQAVAQCVVGIGDGKHKPRMLVQDAVRLAGITGVRAAR
jgi:hypothetical protein